MAIAAVCPVGLLPTATSAAATTRTETFAGHGPTGPLELQLSESINQPANVAPGQKITISVSGSSQAVPTSQSGVPVNYISGLRSLIPVPPNSTFVSGSIVGGNWSFKPSGGGAATSGPLTVTECTAASNDCTATVPDGKTFLGPGTSTPYLEATTGTAQFAAGGTLTMPSWTFDVTAGSSGSIESTISEFDTSANISLAGTPISVALATYPAAAVSGCLATPAVCTAQPAYQFQAIATTTIGTSAGATTTTTTTSGGSTTTTIGTATGAGTTTTVAAVAAGSGGSGGSSSVSASGSGSSLAYTGPPKMVWILGTIGLVLLDLGYLVVSATWRRRRAG